VVTGTLLTLIKQKRMSWAGYVARMGVGMGGEELVYVIGGKARDKGTTKNTKT
jgi:hypothetical protein